MMKNEDNARKLYAERVENIWKTVNRNNPDYIPVLANTAQATVSYAGKTYREALQDKENYPVLMTKIFDELYSDCYVPMGSGVYPNADKAMNGKLQLKIGPDGTSIEHVAHPPMRADEYDALIADPNAFVCDVLIPRLFPFLFEEGIDKAKKRVQALIEDVVYIGNEFDSAADERVRSVYGIAPLMSYTSGPIVPNPPMDTIFDCYRGFKNTMLDLRRRPAEVKAACDKMWANAYFEETIAIPFPFSGAAPHIPAYLSPKQFEELFWPHYKQIIEYLHSNGSKFVIMTEGRWMHIFDYFREVPKNSCVFLIDDDDVVEAYKKIGDWQCIAGGAKLAKMRTDTKQQTIDYAKRVIDECAPGGSFIFTTDKAWNSPNDINQNLIDVYNFAHEYGKY